ncbi:hypothetical protein RB195_016345 [Necator americanus]
MLSGTTRAALISLQYRAISTTPLTKCFDPRSIRPIGFSSLLKKNESVNGVNPAFVAAEMLIKPRRTQKSQNSCTRVHMHDRKPLLKAIIQDERIEPKTM